jgi:hypothetical protein
VIARRAVAATAVPLLVASFAAFNTGAASAASMRAGSTRAVAAPHPGRGRGAVATIDAAKPRKSLDQLGARLTAASNPCGPPVVNPVACENTKPGTPPDVWSIGDGPGDLSIQGFATQASVDPGQTVYFKIKTPSTAYHLDIYRVGWYGGDGARLMAGDVKPSVSLPQTQPPCLVDNSDTTGLIDCGNWSVSASWTVPTTAVSGMYFADVIRDDSQDPGGESQIMWVVRDDSSHSNIVYQTSDTTREAYNPYDDVMSDEENFVGNSLYQCTIACPPGNPLEYKGAYEVSLNRPNIAAGLGGMYSFWDVEFPMVEFLEENGYDVSYISAVDTDQNGSLLLNHKVFMDSGHDEYWSAGQRANVIAARNAGVSLAFFSGNESFWKTRWQNSTDGTNTPYRTIVCYKETHFSAPTDPQDPPTWTGTWRDTRASPPADGGNPENAMSGQAYMVDPPNTFAIQVPGTYADLRFWRNTSIAKLSPSQTATLAPDTLGYEWDEDLDNGYRPAGEFDMSSTTEKVSELLQDLGSTTGPGTATHHLTEYRAASGALVFGAGTVQWAYGLEPGHNPSADQDMQQATVNLFADMGVQPATLMSNLVPATESADHTPPTSHISSPSAGQTLASGSTVTVSGTASDSGGGVVAGVEVSTDGGATWHPASGTSSWTYTWNVSGNGPVTVESRATDDSGNIETPSDGVPVTVNCPCQMYAASATPPQADSGDANAVEVGTKFQASTTGYITGVRFYKATANTGTHVGDLWSASGQLLAQATFTNESASGWQQVTFSQPVLIQANTTYVVSYHTMTGHYSVAPYGFELSARNSPPLTASLDTWANPNGVYTYSSTPTFPSSSYNGTDYYVDAVFVPNSGPPSVINHSPGSGATNVSTISPVTATFNEDIQPSTLSFTLKDGSGNTVPATLGYNSSNYTATLTPSSPLNPGTTYTVNVSGAENDSGTSMTGPTTWNFSTYSCPCTLWSTSTTPSVVDAGDPNSVELGVKFHAEVNGYINGLRFYKSSANTGTHVGSLWSSTGTLLAQGTFTNESASGWQTLEFASPVPVTANTTYVVSYHTNTGHYSDDSGYFAASGVDNGPLHAPSSGASGGNGVYAYASSPTFPSSSYNSSNYWVDPIFDNVGSGNTSPPSVSSTTPASGATGVPSNLGTVSAVFNSPIEPSSLSFTLTGPGGAQVPGTASYDVSTSTASLNLSSSLIDSDTYTATVSATGLNGVAMTAPYNWSFTVAQPSCPCSIWPSTATPANPSSSDSSSLEVGVRFQADTNGEVTGIRFYKGSGNTGTHLGDLWTNSGQLLATGTFTNETATGWQQLNFANPVPVTAGTTYVASYYDPNGHYAADPGYFSNSGVDNSPLHALSNAVAGGNGVFEYGPSGFPNQSYDATNYWVDVVFNATSPNTTPPSVSSTNPASGATGVANNLNEVTATFNEPIQSSSLSFNLTGPGGTQVPGTSSYNTATSTAIFAPSVGLTDSATYTATVSATGLNGVAMTAPFTWSFTVEQPSCPCTIFSPSSAPANPSSSDSSSLEVGVRFQADTNGYVTGIRFYKGSGNTGTHLGDLWTNSGQLLATGVFTNESATGWQQLNFENSVPITAGTTYVASYYDPNGHYAADPGYFSNSGVDNSPLHALSNAVAGGNGVFEYGPSGFPNQSYGATNYWVDVVFNTTAQPPVRTTPPQVTSTTPAPGATGVSTSTPVSATFDEPINPGSLDFSLATESGSQVAGTASYDDVTQTATFSPSSPLASSTSYTASISATDLAGNTISPPVTWSFTTVSAACPCSLWPSTLTPPEVDSGDGSAYELGVRFTSDENGYVTGVRFYKSTANTGTHIGHLWSNTGQLLASATFTNETASGWQSVTFSSPVAVTAGATYIASYWDPSGHYAFSANYFGSSYDNPPLHAPASGSSGGNGVFLPGSSGFPADSFNASNYWVDVTFTTSVG